MSIETDKYNELEEQYKLESSPQKRQAITQKQIKILQTVQKQFIEQVKLKGIPLDSYNVLEMLMNQYKGMKQLAERDGLNTDKYNLRIEQIKIKIFGKKI